ncbi:MAG: chemotaxis protein CheA [Gammaproteobacteria bacterium]
MSSDLSQFYETFFEESYELLEDMEANLVKLEPGVPDPEVVNTIFRAAHSIKGGSATFNFTDIAQLTHVAETYLDEVRNGEQELTDNAISLLLDSVDCTRDMISCIQNQQSIDQERSQFLKSGFEELIAGGKQVNKADTADTQQQEDEPEDLEALFDSLRQEEQQKNDQTSSPSPVVPSEIKKWKIVFTPNEDYLAHGNDPRFLFKELYTLGDCSLQLLTTNIPEYQQLELQKCYLMWEILLATQASKEQIEEVFTWVVNPDNIAITEVSTNSENLPESSAQLAQPKNVATETASLSVKSVSAPLPQEIQETTMTSSPARVSTTEKTIPTPAVLKIETKSPVKPATNVDAASKEPASIRVSIGKVDSLINLVGELVITQSMLGQVSKNFTPKDLPKLREGLSQLEQNSRQLQENVMQIRMLPIGTTFNRFPRLIRDISKKLGKKIDLKISGESTELDKTVMEKIGDPLVHLVRNSADHGIESPEVRKSIGKPEQGTVHLNAFHQGGNIVIEISDDGAGLNCEKILKKAIQNKLVSETAELSKSEIYDLLFQPGFSTADVVTDLSGRGVGMDVVRRNIIELGGHIEVDSELGKGSRFTIRLPLTLAILDGQLFRLGKQIYVVPLVSIVETVQVNKSRLESFGGTGKVYHLRDHYIPIILLYDLLALHEEIERKELEDGFLIIVNVGNKLYGLFIDELLSHQQVVIKSLEANYRKIEGLSGATILGDGTVALIIDTPGLVRLAGDMLNKAEGF